MKKAAVMLFCLLFFIAHTYAKKVIDVAAGKNHTLVLFDDGAILAFGDNLYGQLGIGFRSGLHKSPAEHTNSTAEPQTYINSPQKFVSVAAGFRHSLAVADDGTLWGWGNNEKGQLGIAIPFYADGGSTCITSPVKLDPDEDWVKVFANGFYSFALKKNGTLWYFFSRTFVFRYQQIKHPNNIKWKSIQLYTAEPVLSDCELNAIMEDNNGKLWTFGDCNTTTDEYSCFNAWRKQKKDGFTFFDPVLLEVPSGVSSFSMTDFAGAYKKDTDVYLWGTTLYDEKFIAKKYWEPVVFAVENDTPVPERDDAWLIDNIKKIKIKQCKQLITGNFTEQGLFMSDILAKFYGTREEPLCFYTYTVCLSKDGQLTLWTNGKRFEKKADKKIIKIWGGYSIFAQTEDGKLYAIGYNTNRRLGIDTDDEDTFYFLTPVYK